MSDQALSNIILRLTNLYQNAPHMDAQQLLSAADGIYGSTLLMARNRQRNTIPPAPPRQAAPFSGPYTAPLRPSTRYNPLEKTVVVAKKKLNTDCPSECSICQETPKFKDAVCTECDHYYCKTCWTGWMNAPGSNKKCPSCRKDMPKTTAYKARASKKPTGPMTAPLRQVMIIEDDDDVIQPTTPPQQDIPRGYLGGSYEAYPRQFFRSISDNDVTHMSASIDDF